MMLAEDGSIWATGSNQDGQFGDGSTTSEIRFAKLSIFDPGGRHHTNCTSILMPVQPLSVLHDMLQFVLILLVRRFVYFYFLLHIHLGISDN